MGYNGAGSLTAVCANVNQNSTYARVFEQDDSVDELSVSCIQFGYFMQGKTTVTLSLYMDANGGDPDAAMVLLDSIDVSTINAVGQFQVQTASFAESVKIQYPNDVATLVVVLSTPAMAEGTIVGGGSPNAELVMTVGDTYVGGDCLPGGQYITYYDYATTNNLVGKEANQWFVKLSANTGKSGSGDGDDDELSDGALAGVVIGAVAGAAILGVVGFYVFTKVLGGGNAANKESLLAKA